MWRDRQAPDAPDQRRLCDNRGRVAREEHHRGRRFPVAERLGATGLYLPSGPHLVEGQIARVADAISRAGRP